MRKTATLVFVYGLIIFIGGLMGHYKAGSIASLISGIVFGALLIGASWLIFKKKRWGVWSALVLAIFLDGFFTFRYAKSLKFLPPGLLSLLSLIVVILLALRLRMASKSR